jgi:HlyD family secretion protein
MITKSEAIKPGPQKVTELSSLRREDGVRVAGTGGQDRLIDQAPRRRRRLLVAGATIAGLLIVTAIAIPSLNRYTSAQISVPAARLRLAEVTRGEFVRDVVVEGTVVAAMSPTLFAPAEGNVAFRVNPGDTVKAGDVLAVLDSPELTNRLAQERATLQGLRSGVERRAIEKKTQELRDRQTADLAAVDVQAAERELRRAESAHHDQVISERDYEKAQDDLERARLQHRHALENARLQSESLAFEIQTLTLDADRQELLVKELERQVDGLMIRSPVDGMVGSRAVNDHAAVARSAPLMTVVDLSAFEIELLIPQAYGDDLTLGLDAEVSYGQHSYPAQVTSISPEVQQNQVKGRVRFKDSVPEGLRQNQRVSVRIVLESKPDTLKVQRGPFLDSGGGRVAYVVHDGMAERRAVRIGSTSLREVEILEGLAAGETIIISSISELGDAGTVLLTD